MLPDTKGLIYFFGTVCSEEDIVKRGCNFAKIGFSLDPINDFRNLNEIIPTPMVIVDVLKGCYLSEFLEFQRQNSNQHLKGGWYPSSIKHEWREAFGHKPSVIANDIYKPYRNYKIDPDNDDAMCDAFGTYYA